MSFKKISITLRRSKINASPIQKACLLSLGLSRIGKTVIRTNNPSIMGTVNKVSHMVEVKTEI